LEALETQAQEKKYDWQKQQVLGNEDYNDF